MARRRPSSHSVTLRENKVCDCCKRDAVQGSTDLLNEELFSSFLNCGCVSCWATKIHDKAAPAATEDGADRFKIDKRRPFHILKDAGVVK
jgi:hypothetical protein